MSESSFSLHSSERSKPVENESGWLIERADSSPAEPRYWAAGQREAERSSAWTSNHMQAIRFARKEDAERVAARIMKDIDVRICEHDWSVTTKRTALTPRDDG
jgi:hypothetical protein